MFFCAFFPQLRETLWEIFGFLRIFPQKNAFYPKKSPYNAVFFRKRLWKILLKFPAVLWVFSPKPIFSTQSRTKFPTIAGNFVEKSKDRRYGAGDRRVAPALCGRKSGLFRKPSRRLDPSFVSRCVSKSYVNITKVMRNRISTTEIRFRGKRPPQGATIGIRISRERPPQARLPKFVFHGNARRKARPPKFVFHGNARRKAHRGAERKKGKPQACLFLFFRNALILREARAYLRDRTDTLPDSKRRRRHRCSTCCRPC